MNEKSPAIFGTSFHKDITERLKKQNALLYAQVQQVLSVNKAQRHLRGGMATRHKYHPEK
ncbi:MAG TPA: sporulation transcriptional regulator SpoIIID [Candidatus Ruthenibacterium merdavium]|uniref:Sporulation transcriptional regulator SpoIIID n=1 Tax=Candidatus Ruthenibacterium merdavium TaxID=2838752 RepID=A0A9D2Q698_9FIRM|nr:sporulation transcriptional regulator SpoIIID [Candidatus Ruthenibacterium merdavium]